MLSLTIVNISNAESLKEEQTTFVWEIVIPIKSLFKT